MKRLLCLIFMVLALLLPMTAFAVQPPTVTTNAATSITSSGATLNGTANANFADSAVSFEYVTSSTLAATPATVSGNTPVSFSGALTGLTPGTSYNFWAVATNIGGTTLGSVLSFTTKLIQSITFGSAPTVLKDGTGTVSATAAPSGLTVAFTSLTPTTCSTSGTNGSTVTGLIVGNNNCTIAANQTGNGTYDTATQKTQTFSILKATPTVTVTVGTYTYNAAAQGPTVAVTSPVSTGTVTWSYVGVSGTTYGPSAALPTGAGSYTATATVGADSNNNIASSAATAFTIAKANTTATVTVGTYTYNAAAQGPTVAVTSPVSTGTVTWSYVGVSGTTYGPSAALPTLAGSYTATASVGLDSNNNAAASTATSFSIGKATPTVTVTVGTYTYNAAAQGPTVTVTSPVSTGTVTWSYVGVSGTTYGPSATLPTGAGSYTATATVGADSNNNIASSAATAFTIAKANTTATVTVGTYTYNAAAQGPTVAVTSPVSTGTVTWSYVGVSGTTYGPSAALPTGAGSYTATATVATDSNYNSAISIATGFTISKANTSTISVTGPTYYAYDGNSQGPDTVATTGSTGAVTYSYVGTGLTSYGASATKPSAAGTYSVTATLAADSNFLGATSTAKPFNITTARTVITTGDSGSGSLRKTIADASPGDIIQFAASVTGTITLTSGEIAISRDLTINGPATISGGGTSRIFNVSGTTAFALNNLTMTNGNAGNGSGGAIVSGAATTTTISGCTFSGNKVGSDGGAIFANGTMSINDSLFTGNSAFDGGAIANMNVLTLTNVTISGNSAEESAGGIFNELSTSTTTLINTTVAANSAGMGFGGISMPMDSILNLKNSILANNTAPIYANYGGPFATNVNSLVDLDAKLAPLANNGGPTLTMAPLYNSPAINAGNCTTGPATDQRGMARPQNGTCDIGAYERGTAASLTATGGTPQSATINTAFTNPLTAKVTDSLGGVLDGISVTFAGTGFSGSASNTDATGVASFAATANGNAGAYIATAKVGSLTADFSLTNSKGSSTISANGTTTFTYNGSGQVPASYTNLTGSTGAVSYSYSGKSPTVYSTSSNKPSAAGTYTVIATVAADNNYNTASSAPLDFTINKAGLTITAANTTSTYGTAPTVTAVYSAFVNNETSAVLTTQPVCSSTVTATTAYSASFYTAANSCSGAAAANYTLTYQPGNATVNTATITVTADNKTKILGSVNPALTASYSGFVNNETVANISGTPVLATAALTTSPLGNYDITTAIGTLIASNYDFALVKGTLTIAYDTTPPSLTISTLSDNATSSTGIINVSGTATAAINGLKSVTVNGTAVTVSSAGSFSYPVLLLPGINSISAVATDNADLTTTVTRHITLDATAPLIRLSGDISDNSVTHVADHILTVNVFAAGTTVTVSLNGGTATAATVPAGGDTFTSPVTLAAGLNTIEIFATDSHGKTSSIKISATLNTALSLDMTQPANDLKMKLGDMTLSGTVSGTGTPPFTVTVKMDGQTFTPAILGDGTFSQALHFASEKTYPITVTASDTSGNSVTAIRNVTYALLGDQNGNGSVTIEDVIKAYRIDKGLDPAAGTDMLRLDVAPLDKDGKPQGNGIIDLGDVILLLRYVAGVITW